MKTLFTLLCACLAFSCLGQVKLKSEKQSTLKGHVEIHTFGRKNTDSRMVEFTATYRGAAEKYNPIKADNGKAYKFVSVAELFNYMEKQGYTFITVIPLKEEAKLSLKGYEVGSFLFKKL